MNNMMRNYIKLAPKLASHQSTRSLKLQAAIKGVGEKVVALKNSDTTKLAIKSALIELRPPTPMEIPRAIMDGFRLFTKPNWQNITVREACRNTLVTIEVVCWFFVGECIGKGTLIGYQV